jgi:enediyne biosynthesis protein E4
VDKLGRGHIRCDALPSTSWIVRNARRWVAIAVVVVLWIAMQPPEVPAHLRSEAAERFHLERTKLADFAAAPIPREVHPSLRHLVPWMMGIGASVAINDLDGDGLPNDLCQVDSRIDRVVISPAPGTPQRYAPYALDPAPLPFDALLMKPMGCAPADLNEDGAIDVIVYYFGRAPIAFLRSRDGWVPTEIADPEERWYTGTMTTADLDGDGHLDLFFGDYYPDGSRMFDPSPEHADDVQIMPRSAGRALNGGLKHVFLFKGVTEGDPPGVRFEEAQVLDEEVNHGWSLAIGAQDLDGDLLPEIYMANDYGPDRLLHNRSTPGHLSFARLEGRTTLSTAHSKVLGRDSFKGMGLDFGDLNGDGFPDFMVSNLGARRTLMEHHFVFMSTGEISAMKEGVAPYVDESDPLGLARNSWGWDLKLIDLDNDGALEVVQALGFVRGKHNRWPELQELGTANDELLPSTQAWPLLTSEDDISGHEWVPLMVRVGDRFTDIAPDLGLDQLQMGRGIAPADVDGDGDIDYAIADQHEPSFLYTNRCIETKRCGRFLGLHVRLPLRPGAPENTIVRAGHPTRDGAGDTIKVGDSRPAIGARVALRRSDGKTMTAQVDGGNGYAGRRSPDIHFGLGAGAPDEKLEVEIAFRDPSGAVRSEALRLEPGWHSVMLGWPGHGGERR